MIRNKLQFLSDLSMAQFSTSLFIVIFASLRLSVEIGSSKQCFSMFFFERERLTILRLHFRVHQFTFKIWYIIHWRQTKKVYKAISIYTKLYLIIPSYTNLYQAAPSDTKIYQGILYQAEPIYTNLYQAIPSFTKLHQAKPSYTNQY